LELDDRLVNRSIKTKILTTTSYKSNPNLATLLLAYMSCFTPLAE
jgi:hypothetical protein